jgi:hypothetical protein
MEDRSKYKSYGAFIGSDIGDDCIEKTREIYNKVTRKDDNRHLGCFIGSPFVTEVYTQPSDFIDDCMNDSTDEYVKNFINEYFNKT